MAADGSVTLNGQHLMIGQRAFEPRHISRENLAGSTRFRLGGDGEQATEGEVIEIRGYGHGDRPERPARPEKGSHPVGRVIAWVVGVLATLALLVGGLWWWGDSNYFVGERDGQVQIRRGFDVNLLGQELSALEEQTDLAVDDLPGFYADSVRDAIPADDMDDARQTVTDLRERAERRRQEDSGPEPSGSSGSSGTSSSSSPSSSSTSGSASPSPSPSPTSGGQGSGSPSPSPSPSPTSGGSSS